MLENNSKPKLCYIAPSYAHDDATHFSHLYDFIREISKQFDIFLIIEKGEQPKEKFGCTRVKVLWFRLLPLRWCELHCRLLKARFLGYSRAYVHYSFLAAVASSIVMRPFGGTVWYWNCGEPWKYKRGEIRDWFERLAYEAVSFLVTGTEGLAKKYSEVYGISREKINIMPNWVSLARFTPDGGAFQLKIQLGISTDAKVVLFVHRLSQRKGAQYLSEIAESLKDENAVLVVAGDGPERESVKLKMKSLKLEGKVRFVGAVPNHQMPLYYSMADVLIIPSDEEGFPRVMLEAAAMGVPFAAFAVGGIAEVIPAEYKRYIAPSGDVAVFNTIVRELFELSSDEKERLSQELKNWVKQFDVSKVANRFLEIILKS
ncbi:MAG: glycosyltransferase family 4 protein [Patescibacteria group bacterium]